MDVQGSLIHTEEGISTSSPQRGTVPVREPSTRFRLYSGTSGAGIEVASVEQSPNAKLQREQSTSTHMYYCCMLYATPLQESICFCLKTKYASLCAVRSARHA